MEVMTETRRQQTKYSVSVFRIYMVLHYNIFTRIFIREIIRAGRILESI